MAIEFPLLFLVKYHQNGGFFPATAMSVYGGVFTSNLLIRKQALKQKKADSDSSAASDTSDEETVKRRKLQLPPRE